MNAEKQYELLYLFSQPAEKFWTALYYCPCGNYRDPVSVPFDTLVLRNEKLRAFELLESIVNAKCAQSQWESVSALYSYLETSDRNGRIDSKTWLQLCRPLDKRLQEIFQRSVVEKSLKKSRNERMVAVDPRGLIAGYENHQLVNEGERWFVLLEQREEALSGSRSYYVSQAKMDHANFYVRHEQKSKAQAIIDSIQGDFGKDWNIGFKNFGNTSKYYCKRKDGKNSVRFEE